MANLETEEITHSHWGRCVRLSDGAIELVATLDFGPRIIRFGLAGGENEFFEDTDDVINKVGNSAFDIYGDEGYWHIYGGHRLWTSPEQLPRSYYPDNEPVEYNLIENGIRLTPPPQAWNELQLEMDVVINDGGRVEVTHKITNIGAWEIELAPWALTVMKTGGLEVIPQNQNDTGMLHNRVLALWPYSRINDKRVGWGDHFITLRPDAAADGPFKLGVNNDRGFAAYFNNGNLFIKRFLPVDGGTYPDGGVSYETFTNKHMVELESLGQLQKIKPEHTAVHTEVWELIPGVAEPQTDYEIDAAIKQYIEK